MGDFNIFHHMPWASTYSIYFFVIGISAALFFFSTLSWFSDAFVPIRMRAFVVSFALLVIGGLLLIGDLSQPMRFINILNPLYLNFTSPSGLGRFKPDVLWAGVGPLFPRDESRTSRR